MKSSTLPRSKVLVGAIVGIALAGSAAALAQVAPPSPAPVPAPAVPAAPVVAPVVPTSPAQNPGAVAAIEQSVSQQPAPAASQDASVPASSSATGYQVPAAGPGIFQGSDQTLREIAYLQTEVALNGKRKELMESRTALKESERDLTDQLAGRSKDDKQAAAPGGAPAAAPGAVAVVMAKPEPYVNSVYGYGDEMYAEIVIGSTKVLASKGTVLSDGSRVSAISASSVTISGRGGTKRLLVRGAAGF